MKLKVYFLLLTMVSAILLSGCSSKSKEVSDQMPESTVYFTAKYLDKDLNGDQIADPISIECKKHSYNHLNDYKITVKSGTKEHTYSGSTDNLNSGINFWPGGLDGVCEYFYLTAEGPSADPCAIFFRLDKDGVKKIMDVYGIIKEIGPESKVYTDYSTTQDKYKQLLSYYDLKKGQVVFIPKTDLIGKPLEYDHTLILFNEVESQHRSFMSNVYLEKEEDINKILSMYSKDDVAKVIKPHEKLAIMDIDRGPKDNYISNVRIKVRCTDGSEGWLEWMNGGD